MHWEEKRKSKLSVFQESELQVLAQLPAHSLRPHGIHVHFVFFGRISKGTGWLTSPLHPVAETACLGQSEMLVISPSY